MKTIPVRFVIGQLSAEEIDDLKNDHVITSKLLLSPSDYEIFNYRAGDTIEVENHDGYRQWCIILDLEIIKTSFDVILIFSLQRADISSEHALRVKAR